MIGMILAGVGIFAVSELLGEVYYDNNSYKNNDILINTGRSIANIAMPKKASTSSIESDKTKSLEVDKLAPEEVETVYAPMEQEVSPAFTVQSEEETKIPDFTEPVKPLNEEETETTTEEASNEDKEDKNEAAQKKTTKRNTKKTTKK